MFQLSTILFEYDQQIALSLRFGILVYVWLR